MKIPFFLRTVFAIFNKAGFGKIRATATFMIIGAPFFSFFDKRMPLFFVANPNSCNSQRIKVRPQSTRIPQFGRRQPHVPFLPGYKPKFVPIHSGRRTYNHDRIHPKSVGGCIARGISGNEGTRFFQITVRLSSAERYRILLSCVNQTAGAR